MSEARGALKLGEDVGLCIDGAEEHSDSPGPNTLRKRSRRLGAFLERAVPGLIRESKVSGLVLVGGDTAHSVLAGLQANAVELGGEVQRGIPMGTVAGGDADGKFVVTKGGGFGDRDALVNAVARIARERATGPG